MTSNAFRTIAFCRMSQKRENLFPENLNARFGHIRANWGAQWCIFGAQWCIFGAQRGFLALNGAFWRLEILAADNGLNMPAPYMVSRLTF